METFVDQLITLLFGILTVALTPLIIALVVKLLQKFGLSVQAEQQAKLEKIAQDAIFLAEEKARRFAKANITLKLPSDDKLRIAITEILQKVPGLREDEARLLVHQELPKVRASVEGFLKATTAAVTQ